MRSLRFDKIAIVGSGTISCEIVQVLIPEIDLKKLVVLELKENTLSFLEKICKKKGIHYISLLETNKLEECLISETIENPHVLVISANNRHIFSKKILSLPDFEVINFHYSYLPNYRGMNIPTWVIYNQEPYTGITWHYVTKIIDGGRIIARKKISLADDTTAFDVTYQGMKLGIEAFKGFIFELLKKPIEGVEISEGELGAIYLNNEIPENGCLNLNDSFDNVYKLLRCFDYGKSGVLRPLTVENNGREYYVRGYKKISSERDYNKQKNEIIVYGKMFNLVITIAELQ